MPFFVLLWRRGQRWIFPKCWPGWRSIHAPKRHMMHMVHCSLQWLRNGPRSRSFSQGKIAEKGREANPHRNSGELSLGPSAIKVLKVNQTSNRHENLVSILLWMPHMHKFSCKFESNCLKQGSYEQGQESAIPTNTVSPPRPRPRHGVHTTLRWNRKILSRPFG